MCSKGVARSRHTTTRKHQALARSVPPDASRLSRVYSSSNRCPGSCGVMVRSRSMELPRLLGCPPGRDTRRAALSTDGPRDRDGLPPGARRAASSTASDRADTTGVHSAAYRKGRGRMELVTAQTTLEPRLCTCHLSKTSAAVGVHPSLGGRAQGGEGSGHGGRDGV